MKTIAEHTVQWRIYTKRRAARREQKRAMKETAMTTAKAVVIATKLIAALAGGYAILFAAASI